MNNPVNCGAVNPSFSQPSGSPAGAGGVPYSVAVGDFNGDGKQDLVVANLIAKDVTILLGAGSGGFSPAPGSPVSAGGTPDSVAVGDFNGDGQTDIAVWRPGNGTWYSLNSSDGSVRSKQHGQVGDLPVTARP